MALEIIAPLAAMFTAALVVWGVYSLATAQSAAVRQRIAQYGAGRAAQFGTATTSPLLKDRSLSAIGGLDRLLSGRGYTDRVARDLVRAAIPLRVGEYLLIRWVAGVVFFMLAQILTASILFAVISGALGFLIPKFYVGGREKARIRKVEDQLVDALTMMSNSLRSGSAFVQAMDLVSRELPAPIAQEFAQVVAEVGVGAPVEQALADMTERVRSYDVYMVATAMTIQRNVGGNLAEVLQSIAHTIRERQKLLRQVQVETAEQRFSAYLLMALPSLMLLAIASFNRGYLDPLLAPGLGRLMLGGALFLQIVGYYIMRRIADIKV